MKLLFFFMFFFEWYIKIGKIEKIDLKNGGSCKKFLNNIFLVLVKNFDLFDFNGLDEKV